MQLLILVVLVGLAADERLDAHRVLTDRQDRVGLEASFAGQFDDDAGQSAVGALVEGVGEMVFLEGVHDRPLDGVVGSLPQRITHARTPRRLENRRAVRRDSVWSACGCRSR